jgi:hypothetical protein
MLCDALHNNATRRSTCSRNAFFGGVISSSGCALAARQDAALSAALSEGEAKAWMSLLVPAGLGSGRGSTRGYL